MFVWNNIKLIQIKQSRGNPNKNVFALCQTLFFQEWWNIQVTACKYIVPIWQQGPEEPNHSQTSTNTHKGLSEGEDSELFFKSYQAQGAEGTCGAFKQNW